MGVFFCHWGGRPSYMDRKQVDIPKTSNALKKFQSQHPEQQKLFSSIFQTAKKTRNQVFPIPCGSEEINGEWSNMLRNEELVKFREADREIKTKKNGKIVRWRENLLDIKTITPQGFEYPCSQINLYQDFPVWTKKKVSTYGGKAQQHIFDSRKTTYSEVVLNASKQVVQENSFALFLRNDEVQR